MSTLGIRFLFFICLFYHTFSLPTTDVDILFDPIHNNDTNSGWKPFYEQVTITVKIPKGSSYFSHSATTITILPHKFIVQEACCSFSFAHYAYFGHTVGQFFGTPSNDDSYRGGCTAVHGITLPANEQVSVRPFTNSGTSRETYCTLTGLLYKFPHHIPIPYYSPPITKYKHLDIHAHGKHLVYTVGQRPYVVTTLCGGPSPNHLSITYSGHTIGYFATANHFGCYNFNGLVLPPGEEIYCTTTGTFDAAASYCSISGYESYFGEHGEEQQHFLAPAPPFLAYKKKQRKTKYTPVPGHTHSAAPVATLGGGGWMVTDVCVGQIDDGFRFVGGAIGEFFGRGTGCTTFPDGILLPGNEEIQCAPFGETVAETFCTMSGFDLS